jgi:hypothetical protein
VLGLLKLKGILDSTGGRQSSQFIESYVFFSQDMQCHVEKTPKEARIGVVSKNALPKILYSWPLPLLYSSTEKDYTVDKGSHYRNRLVLLGKMNKLWDLLQDLLRSISPSISLDISADSWQILMVVILCSLSACALRPLTVVSNIFLYSILAGFPGAS